MKRAVVMMNLGGPQHLDEVKDFLLEIFNDPLIIRLPNPWRWLVAQLISRRRAPQARQVYSLLGGRSPLFEETEAQARALENLLGEEWRVFVAMRYARPRAAEVVSAIAAWGPDEVVLCPLYPQYSTTTTLSSVREWEVVAKEWGWPTRVVTSYPTLPGLVRYYQASIGEALRGFEQARVLFSAHGLPQKIVDEGDPYVEQVKATVEAVVAGLPDEVEWVLSFQSRVGPMKWVKPYTDQEIKRAGAEGRGVILVPIAFVSEHAETLIEMDVEYKELAIASGVPFYKRILTPRTDAGFLEGLKERISA